MAQPFVGQIIAVGFKWVPVGWLPCDGSLQPITTYEALYSLIGTTYGGNGVSTFAMPDLRGRVPLGMGTAPGRSPYVQGQLGGAEGVTLTANQVWAHNHALMLSGFNATASAPTAGATVGTLDTKKVTQVVGIYAGAAPTTALLPQSVGFSTNGGQPHENRQPFQVANYIIAYNGIFPSQN